jgi:hypothetical protein
MLRLDTLTSICNHLDRCIDLANFACVNKVTRDYVMKTDHHHWETIAKEMGCLLKGAPVMYSICPWMFRSDFIKPQASVLGDTYVCGEMKSWALLPSENQIHIQCTFEKRQFWKEGGMVLSSINKNQVLKVIDTVEDAIVNDQEWSAGIAQVYAVLRDAGFIPKWMTQSEPKNNIDIVVIHKRCIAVAVKTPDKPVIHIFHVNGTPAHKKLHLVRSIQVPKMAVCLSILSQNQTLWIPQKNGRFQVWGEVGGLRFLVHRTEIAHILFHTLNENTGQALRCFNRTIGFVKANVNMRMPGTGDTLLHAAVRQNAITIVEMLLRFGANPNAREALDGFTPMTMSYTSVPEPNVLRLLAYYGGDPNVPLSNGDGALNKCVENIACLRALLLFVPNVDWTRVCKNTGETALQTAKRLGQMDAVRLLQKCVSK